MECIPLIRIRAQAAKKLFSTNAPSGCLWDKDNCDLSGWKFIMVIMPFQEYTLLVPL
jgi:hypothetical protein